MSFTTTVSRHGPGKAIAIATPALRVTVTTLGASVRNVKVLAKGQWVEVNNHYADYEEAFGDNATYIGATVGRFAGRICNGTFTLDNEIHHTPRNQDGKHTIHGGGAAFDKKHWSFEVFNTEKDIGVVFTYVSPHCENGFPAELRCKVTYLIEKAKPSALQMLYDAYIPESSPAEATIVNMFNHCYWNLNGVPVEGEGSTGGHAVRLARDVKNHILRMPNCDKVLETDNLAIPSGHVKDVSSDSIFDFRAGKAVGAGILEKKRLCRDPPGFDHPFLISGYDKSKKTLLLNAEVASPATGISMAVYSTFPTVWIYTANNMREDANGQRGQRHGRYGSICVEPQHPPDAVNHVEDFPSNVFVRKGSPYAEKIVTVFSTSEGGDSRSKL